MRKIMELGSKLWSNLSPMFKPLHHSIFIFVVVVVGWFLPFRVCRTDWRHEQNPADGRFQNPSHPAKTRSEILFKNLPLYICIIRPKK